jgi:Ran GTPase-activating protein (RanGAP) involved in mRNA processing and transport
MDKTINKEIHLENLQHIENLLNKLPAADIWCAWGANITKRSYLKDCLKDIFNVIQSLDNKNFRFVKKEAINKEENTEHPLHPIASIETEKELQEFDLVKYL